MKVPVGNLFALLALVLLGSSAFADAEPAALTAPEICVLMYERQNHPMTKAVLDIYQNYSKASVKTEAVPLDFVRCISQGAREIVIVAHAIEIKDPKEIRLGYFFRSPDAFQTPKPAYKLGFFLDHVFQIAEQTLSEQEASGQKRLLKIRMMACDPVDVFRAYPSLQKLLSDHQVELDTAPISRFLSKFHDVPVTGFNKAWLAKDISCQDVQNLWRTDRNAYCKYDSWPGCDRKQALYCLPGR
jgi:hypothetical protein